MRFAPALLLLAFAASACAPATDGTHPAVEGPRLLVLGTAQDGGIPHAACRCDHCSAALRSGERRRLVASLAILSGGRRYLIDATPDLRQQLDRLRDAVGDLSVGIDRSPVDGVFLTHAHLGHYTGLAFFGFEAVHTRELPLWCSPSMARFLRTNAPWSQLVALRNVELREVAPGASIELDGGVRVEPISVPHRDELSDTLGFVIRGPETSVLYVPDTDPWSAWTIPFEELVAEVDVALLDGAFYSREELPDRNLDEIRHPLMTDTMDRLQSIVREGRSEVYFTHLNHSNLALDPGGGPAREIERRGFRVAADGTTIPL